MKKALIGVGAVLVLICGIGGVAMRSMGQAAAGDDKSKTSLGTVARGDIKVTVVEKGTVNADKAVEVKSRVSGRLASLLVGEGDAVTAGQLIATIDPQETELKVQQDEAQLRGARSNVDRGRIEIEQRRQSAKAAYNQAVARLRQLELEAKAQPELTKASIAAAQTALNSAMQDRVRLMQSTQPTQRESARRDVTEAEANYENANLEYRRNVDLESKGYVAGRSVETAKLALDLAKVRLSNAKFALARLDSQFRADTAKAEEAIRQAQAELTKAKINSIQNQIKMEDLESARADVQKAQAALMDAGLLQKGLEQSQATVDQLSSVVGDSRRQLGETNVRAPITGVVTKKLLEIGELASGLSGFSSGTPILRIEDRRNMRVKADMNEIDVAKLNLGMTARIDVDAIPSRRFSGQVVKIAPASKTDASGAASSDSVVRYEVEIRITDATPELRSGMSAKCSIDVLSRDKVLVLPVEYIQREGREAFVYVPSKDPKGKPERRPIVIGASSGSAIEVVSGISEGEKVSRPPFSGPDRKGMMQGGPDE